METESERDELKATSEDRLLEIDSLSQEMGELKVREELVDNLRKHIEEVEVELDRKQEEVYMSPSVHQQVTNNTVSISPWKKTNKKHACRSVAGYAIDSCQVISGS